MADASQNGELQEVIRNGRMAGIQSIAVCFYTNTTRNLEALIISESSKIYRYTASLPLISYIHVTIPMVEMACTRSDF